jgi:hypothetical protein
MTKKKQIECTEDNEEDDELEKLRREALETKKSLAKQISEDNSHQIPSNYDKPRRFRYDRDTSDEDDEDEEDDEQLDKLSLHETNDLNEFFVESTENNKEIKKESPQRIKSRSNTKSKSRSRSRSKRSLSESSSSSDESSPVPPRRLQSVVTKPVIVINSKQNGSYNENSRSSKRYRYENEDDNDYRYRHRKRTNYRH